MQNPYEMEEDGFCRECKTYTTLVNDHNSGDTICSDCGLVLESHFIDEKAEWRTFLQEAEVYEEPIRVGDRNNPFLSSGGLGTVMADPVADETTTHEEKGRIKPWKYRDDKKDCNCAKELYKKAEDGNFLGRLRNTQAAMAACLYLACQEEGSPRTFKEIQANSDGAKLKEINKAVELLKKHLEVGRKTTQAKDITRRYCSNLGLNNHTVKAVLEMCRNQKSLM
ncbi:Zinc finger, TFIIB-type [Sesbania bispinosa]|nr:Zinc finger, TFIIB-type [Sesbania bispinosa]